MARSGHVYFIQEGHVGPVKIGYSKDVTKRLDQLVNANPREMTIRAVLPGGRALERELHKEFAEHHIRGEWFVCAKPITDFIATAPKDLMRSLRARSRRVARRLTAAEARSVWLDQDLRKYEIVRDLKRGGWLMSEAVQRFGPREFRRGPPAHISRANIAKSDGRPPKQRETPAEDAKRNWFDLRFKTDQEAVAASPGWSKSVMYYHFGASGRARGGARVKKSKQD